MSYLITHPAFSAETMPALPAGSSDISFRGDACPCFLVDGLALYVDRQEPGDREVEGAPWYSLQNGETVLIDTERWTDIQAALEVWAAAKVARDHRVFRVHQPDDVGMGKIVGTPHFADWDDGDHLGVMALKLGDRMLLARTQFTVTRVH